MEVGRGAVVARRRRARSAILATAVAVTALLLLLLPPSGASHGEGCTTSCGNISIPYPFGVEPGCYHDGGFNLTCNHSYHPPRLFLGDGTVQVLDISIPNGTVRINSSRLDFDLRPHKGANSTWRAGGPGYGGDGPYILAEKQNNLVALGGDVLVVLLGDDDDGTQLFSSCVPFCLNIVNTRQCTGNGCCQANILEGRGSYRFQPSPARYWRLGGSIGRRRVHSGFGLLL